MSIHRMLAVPAAIALFFAAATCNAQDKPTPNAAVKAKPAAPSTAKPAKAATPTTKQLNGVNAKAQAQSSTAKQAMPAAQALPTEQRSEKSCHGSESDA